VGGSFITMSHCASWPSVFLILLEKDHQKNSHVFLPTIRRWLNDLLQTPICRHCGKINSPRQWVFFDTG
jgi:hypothetical protein